MKIQYPFLDLDSQAKIIPFSSKKLLEILAKEPSGHYLLGNHRYWHGGVHFSDQVTGSTLHEKPIQNIADGKLVAYRLNKKYKISKIKGKKLYYSSSFCLIRHQYTSEEGKPPRSPNAPLAKADWVGRKVELEHDVEARNPNATDDSHAGYSYKVNLLASSQLEILEVSGDYVKAKTLYFAEKIVYRTGNQSSLGYRDGVEVKKLPNLKGTKPLEVDLGKEVYFKAFDGEVMLGKGRDLFTEVPPKDKDANQPDKNELAFYSLYMHLLPFEEYKTYLKAKGASGVKLRDEKRTPILNDKKVSVMFVGDKILEEIRRETVAADKATNEDEVYAYGYLVNSKFERILENGKEVLYSINTGLKSNPDQYVVPTPNSLKKPAFWEYKTQIKATALTALQAYTIGKDNNGQEALALLEEIPKDVVFIYKSPEDIKEHSLLVADQDESQPTPVKLIECKFESGAAKQLCKGNTFYLRENELTDQSLKKDFIPIFDEVVQCDTDFDVKFGDVLGHMGLYETPDLAALEAQEADDAEENIATQTQNGTADAGVASTEPASQNLTAEQPAQQATQAETTGTAGATDDTAQTTTPAAVEACAVEDEIDRKELGIARAGVKVKRQVHFEIFSNETEDKINAFLENKAKVRDGVQYLSFEKDAVFKEGTHPNDFTAQTTTFTLTEPQAVTLSEVVMTKDSVGKDWCEVSVTVGSEIKKGWILKNDPKVKESSQHDWKALGYVMVEEKDDGADGCVDKHEDGFVDVECAKTSDFFKDLYRAIDKDGVGGVTPDEVIAALGTPVLADKIRRIIGYHPTEWDGDATKAKWQPLEAEFEKDGLKDLFDHEKERITELCFWEKVDAIKNTPKVYHFHPIEFIRNMGPSLNAIKIAIDAGHGKDKLTSGKSTAFLPKIKPATADTPRNAWDFTDLETNVVVSEWVFNDYVARVVMDELVHYQGIEIKRFDDETGKTEDVQINTRTTGAVNWGAKHYISCHHNAGGGGGTAWGTFSGVEVHLQAARNRSGTTDRNFANAIIQPRLTGAMGLGSRGIISRPDTARGLSSLGIFTGFLTANDRSAFLVEGGFMDSQTDVQKMLDENHKLYVKHLQAQGRAIAAGVVEALNLVKK